MIKFKMFENKILVCIIDIINMSEIPEYAKKYRNKKYINLYKII